MHSKGLKVGLQVGLGLVIIVLVYWLYTSITGPWQEIERREAITDMTRERMTEVRTALVYFERTEGHFPSTLDSLGMWLDQDSLIQVAADSIFGYEGVSLDSLFISPRSGAMFEYALNDTGRVHIYLLRDPDSNDYIGSAEVDVTQLNAASWE